MRGFKALSACLTVAAVAACGSSDPDTGVTIERIVTISDGDYLASTYVDGILAPAEAGHRDLLTTVRVTDGEVSAQHIEVSNSVTAAPEVLALSPDGATAFVAERLGQRRPGDTTAQQLPPGDRLFAVNISDPGVLTITDTTAITSSPEALAVSPDGSHVAVVSNTATATVLQIVPWTAKRFGEPVPHDLANLGITGDPDRPRGGVLATNVQWHPSGRALAVNIATQNRVAFFTIDTSTVGSAAVRPWGTPVTTGIDPFVGRFTPDGRHYVTSDWGRNLTATDVAARLPTGRSKISVIRLDDPGTAANHRITATAESDKSAEGLAVSPDGRYIATVNMRGTVFPADAPGHDEVASVSMLRLDATSGTLTKIGDYPLDGVLPEGGAFDRTGRYFLATVFQGRDSNAAGPGLQIYRVSDEAPGLTPIQRIPLPHGVHHVAAG
ncbi:lactonase family protein [Nocardia gipuzkoensis]